MCDTYKSESNDTKLNHNEIRNISEMRVETFPHQPCYTRGGGDFIYFSHTDVPRENKKRTQSRG